MDVCENVISCEDIDSNEKIDIDDATTGKNMVSLSFVLFYIYTFNPSVTIGELWLHCV